jgi:hypothetical protein
MFGITSFMFVLAFIALVLDTTLGFQQTQLLLDPMSGGIWSSTHTNIILAAEWTITRTMVGLGEGTTDFLC